MVRNPLWAQPLRTDNIGKEALMKALGGAENAWRDFLVRHSHRDGIALINSCSDERIRDRVRPTGRESVKWLLDIAGRAAANKYRDFDNVDVILYQTWSVLSQQLEDHFTRRYHELPPSGFIIYITEYLQWAMIIRYRFGGAAVSLEVLQAIERPEAIYDVQDLVARAPKDVRAVVKNVMKSRSKLVAHRGVLVHVDRYDESNVFGPTIDTVWLHEALVQLAYEYGSGEGADGRGAVTGVLEVGSGNGLLSTGALQHLRPRRLAALDIDLKSVQCTMRNLSNVADQTSTTIHGIVGAFESSLLRNQFDLVIANPPYVPLPTASRTEEHGDYLTAVAGTELLQTLVRDSLSLLSTDGALLLVFSNLAQAAFDAVVPDSVQVVHLHTERDGIRVLFDLEDVFSDKLWLAQLTESLEWEHSTARHRLQVVALLDKRRFGHAAANSVADRVARMAKANQVVDHGGRNERG